MSIGSLPALTSFALLCVNLDVRINLNIVKFYLCYSYIALRISFYGIIPLFLLSF
jgi:hypothetical protein